MRWYNHIIQKTASDTHPFIWGSIVKKDHGAASLLLRQKNKLFFAHLSAVFTDNCCIAEIFRNLCDVDKKYLKMKNHRDIINKQCRRKLYGRTDIRSKEE